MVTERIGDQHMSKLAAAVLTLTFSVYVGLAAWRVIERQEDPLSFTLWLIGVTAALFIPMVIWAVHSTNREFARRKEEARAWVELRGMGFKLDRHPDEYLLSELPKPPRTRR